MVGELAPNGGYVLDTLGWVYVQRGMLKEARDMGLGDYLVPLDRLDVETMIARFQALESNREAVEALLRQRTKDRRSELEEQFDSLLGAGAGGGR